MVTGSPPACDWCAQYCKIDSESFRCWARTRKAIHYSFSVVELHFTCSFIWLFKWAKASIKVTEMKRLVIETSLFLVAVNDRSAYNQPAPICRRTDYWESKVLWPLHWTRILIGQNDKDINGAQKNVLVFLNFVCCSLKWIDRNANIMYKIAHMRKPLSAEYFLSLSQKKKKAVSIFSSPPAFQYVNYSSHRDWMCAIADVHRDLIETLSIFLFYIKLLYRNNLSKLKSPIWHKQSEGIKWRVPYTDLSLTAESLIYVAYAYLYTCNVKIFRAQRLGFFFFQGCIALVFNWNSIKKGRVISLSIYFCLLLLCSAI